MKPDAFSGHEVFERLLALADEHAWRKLPIGERIGAIGIALLHTPYAAATLEVGDDREVCSVDLSSAVLIYLVPFRPNGVLHRRRRAGLRQPSNLDSAEPGNLPKIVST